MPYQVKKILKDNHVKPYHSKGQNFLINEGIVQKILKRADLSTDDCVLEIGAGLGALTIPLCRKVGRVLALEWDKRLIKILDRMVKDIDNLQIIQTDALSFDYRQPFSQSSSPYIVMGNLPYYLATPLIQRLLTMKDSIKELIFMVQREVGDRLIAEKGQREYGMITLYTNYFSIAQKLFTIPKDVFYPKPKVDSCIIRMRLRNEPPVTIEDEKKFFSLIKAAFAHRRKMLANALKSSHYLKLDPIDIIKSFEDAKLSLKMRPQELSLSEFAHLSVSLLKFQ